MKSDKQKRSVDGRIIVAGKIPAFRGAAHVYLEDVSRADAESVTVAETIVETIAHGEAEETEIPFRLEIADESRINPKNFYSVRVWVDVGGETPDARDLFSDRAYRVLTRGYGDFVEIRIGF